MRVVRIQAERRLVRLRRSGAERLERDRPGDLPAVLVEVGLQAGQRPPHGARRDVDARPEPARTAAGRLRRRVEQRGGIDAAAVRIAAVVRMTLSQRHCHHARPQPWVEQQGSVGRAVVRLERNELALLRANRAGGFRRRLDPAAPGGLQQRVGHFLQPGAVGAPAVVQIDRRIDDQRQRALRAPLGHEVERDVRQRRIQRDRCRDDRPPRTAAPPRRIPERFEVGVRRFPGSSGRLLPGLLLAPLGLEEVQEVALRRQRRGGFAAERTGAVEQHIAQVARVVQRPHRRLLQAAHAAPRLAVAPGLERGVHRQHEVGQAGGLVRAGGGAHDKRHALHGCREARTARHGVNGIDVVQQQQVDVAGLHRRGQLQHLPQRSRAVPAGRAGGARVAVRAVFRVERHGDVRIAGDVVQQVNYGQRRRRAGAAGGHAAAHRQRPPPAGRRVGETAGQCPNRLRRRAGPRGNRLRRVIAHQLEDAVRGARIRLRQQRAPLRHDDVHHGGGNQPFRPRLDRQPLVRLRPAERQPRLELDEPRSPVSAPPAAFRESAPVLDRRQPGFQEIRAERDDQVRAREIVVRNRPAAERRQSGGPQRLMRERLVADPPRADGLGPALYQPVERAAEQRRDDGDPARPRFPQLLGEHLPGVQPVDWLQHALSGRGIRLPPAERTAEAVGVVQALQRRLAADAQAAAVQRMLRVAFDLDRATLARAHQHPAAGGAFAAHRRVPGGHARYDVFRWNHVGYELLRRNRGARRGRRGRRRAAEHLEEGPPSDCLRQCVIRTDDSRIGRRTVRPLRHPTIVGALPDGAAQ